jgi:hypothetical protein
VLGKEIDPGFGDAFTHSILGGSSSSSSTVVGALVGVSPLLLVFRSVRVVAEGGRETDFKGVVLVFFLENQPDFFCFSSSFTTIRSSVKSGSWYQNKINDCDELKKKDTYLWLVKVICKNGEAELV